MQQSKYAYLETYNLKASGPFSDKWYSNGVPTTNEFGFASSNSRGWSYIFKQDFAEDSHEYELAATLNFNASGGAYVLYLQASSDALLGSSSSGSFYAFAIQNPTFSIHGCSAEATLYKSVGGATAKVASASVPCSTETIYHAAFGTDKSLRLWTDNTEYIKWLDTTPLSGAAGIGTTNAPAENFISIVQLGRCAEHAPLPEEPLNASVTKSPGQFGVSVGAFIDDSGPGVAHYHWFRNGTYLTTTLLPRFIDFTAPSVGEVAYTVRAEDFHGNNSPLVKLVNATTLPFSAAQQSSTTCTLGPVYDEENFSFTDGSGPYVPPQLCILPGEYTAPQAPPNSDSPPLPACTIWAHFRNINTTGGSLAGHGYLTFYRNDTHQTLIVEGYTPDGHLLRAWSSLVGLEADQPQTDSVVGRLPTSTKACLQFYTLVGPGITKINNANISYSLFGPNSNSVWRYLISLLPGFQGSAGFPPASAIGYNTKLPGVE